MSYNHPVRLRLTPLHGGELNDVTLRAALSPCAQSQGPGPSVDSATTHAMTGGGGVAVVVTRGGAVPCGNIRRSGQ